MSTTHERESWGVAVFRLRESANRIFSLATRVRSQDVRGQLLRIYEQLRTEEAKLATLADAVEVEAQRGRYPAGVDAGGLPSVSPTVSYAQKNGADD